MNNKSDIDERDDESAEEPKGPFAGARLAAARREQQISIDEVAKELHLDEVKVRSLEDNQFESLGAPVFAKGHLRKYALLVGISVDEAIAEYESLNEAPKDPPVVGKARSVPREIAPGPWLALVLAVALLATAYWWFVMRVPGSAAPPPAVVPAESTETDQSTNSAVVEQLSGQSSTEPGTGEDANDDTAPTTAATETVEAETSADADATAESEPMADGDSTLEVRFSGDCWTEISDARGERLFFALGREGRSVNLVGQPPFSAVFGDAENVSLVVDGEPYTIPAANRSGRMARLTIVAR